MKPIVLPLLLFCFFSTCYTQNDIVYTSSKTAILNNSPSKSKKHNSEYLKASSLRQLSSRITNLQQMIAEYPVQQHEVFNSEDPSTYRLKFEQDQHKLVVHYNQKGEIISSKELYKNIRLPYDICTEITQAYPGWGIIDNSLKIKYNKGNLKSYEYKVLITNNTERKTLTLIK